MEHQSIRTHDGLIEAGPILLIDDDPHVLDTAKAYLESGGFSVLLAINGFQALKIAAKEQPAMIFLDLEMPLMDGYKVLYSLKMDQRTEHVPVILLTAQDMTIDKGRGFELGACMYINKPFNQAKLLAVVHAVMTGDLHFDWGI